MRPLFPIVLALSLILACKGQESPPAATSRPAGVERAGGAEGDKAPRAVPVAEAAKEAAAPAGGHAGPKGGLGTVGVGGYTVELSHEGAIGPGLEAGILVEVKGTPEGRDGKAATWYLWLEDAEGQKLGAPQRLSPERGVLHGHAHAEKGSAAPAALILRLKEGEVDVRASVPLPGRTSAATGEGGHGPDLAHPHPHPHEHAPGGHAATPHHGIVVALVQAGAAGGYAEVKLHDDKGDLELWLGQEEGLVTPLDLPLDAKPRLTFLDLDEGEREVVLAVRDSKSNPDEDGKANVRGAGTNYFIFPGETGADASWLKGKDFAQRVRLSVDVPDKGAWTAELELVPHTH